MSTRASRKELHIALDNAREYQAKYQRDIEWATQKWADWTAEVARLEAFEGLEPNDYIETTQYGRGTVLGLLTSGKHRTAKVFVGAGSAAKIIEIRHWGFKGLVKAGE